MPKIGGLAVGIVAAREVEDSKRLQCSGSAMKYAVAIAALLLALPRPANPQPATFYPSNFPATYKAVLAGARDKWVKDAVVTRVDVQAAYGISQAWLTFDLFSPSTGGHMIYTAGGPQNGHSSFGYIAPINRDRVGTPLPPSLSLDLRDAIAAVRKAGLKGQMGPIHLDMVGASGTPPIAVWSIRVAGGPIMVPLFVDAQSGKFVPWQRASDPPNGSDVQLRDIWNRLLNRNQTPPNSAFDRVQWEIWECINGPTMGAGC